MRYNVHQPRAFRNRIARYLGVLVAAALVATLGLPSAAQAQTPAAPKVAGTGDGTVGSNAATLTASWGGAAWYRFRPRSVAARIYRAWRRMGQSDEGDARLQTATMSDPALSANDPRIHHGVWTISRVLLPGGQRRHVMDNEDRGQS